MGTQKKIWLFFIVTLGTISVLKGYGQNTTNLRSDPLYQQYLFENQYNKAAQSIEELLTEPNSNTETSHPSWLESAVIWAWVNNSSKAENAFDQWTKIGDPEPSAYNQTCFRLLYKGLLLYNSKVLTQAADSIFLASVDFTTRTTLDSVYLADIYGLLGSVYKKLQDLSQADRYYDQSNQLNRRLHRESALANTLTEKIPISIRQNKPESDIESLINEATEIYTKLGDQKLLSVVYNERGYWSFSQGKYRDALNYFLEAVRIREGIKDQSDIELDGPWNNVASVYKLISKPDSARVFLNRALSLARKQGKNLGTYFNNIAVTYAIEGNFQMGLRYFQEAMAAIDSTVNRFDLTSNPNGSILDLNLALFTARKASALYRRYKKEEVFDDLENSRLAMQSSINIMDTIRFLYSFDTKSLLSADTKSFYQIARNIELDLFEKTGDSLYLDEAFRYSGRSKSVILNEYLASNQSHDLNIANVPWLREEDSLKREKNRIESELNLLRTQSPNSPDLANLENELRNTEEEIKRTATIIRRDFPEVYRSLYPSKGIGILEVRNKLADDESFLDFSINKKDEILIFCLTKNGVHYVRDTFPTNLAKEIQSYLSTFTAMVNTEIALRFVALSHNIYNGFILPIENYLVGNKLIISPDENLGFLPFESLIREKPETNEPDFRELDYMNRRYAISYIHSHTQLIFRNSKNHSQSFHEIIAFAPFSEKGIQSEEGPLPSLPYSRMEIKQIRKSFPVKYYSGSKATKEQFIKTFDSNSILHVSTHGVLNVENPMETRILFCPNPEGFKFHLSELLDRRVRVPMVVLNACNTGAGSILPGEGVFSIARGFQFAGVPSMITTLWPVDDRSATLIMAAFYRHLKEGLPRSVALQKAREDYYLSADLSSSAPYYWCGHVLFGDSGPLKRSNKWLSWIPWMTLFAGSVILLILGRLILRSKSRR